MKFKRKDWDLSEVGSFAMLMAVAMAVTCPWNPLLLMYVIYKVEPPEDFPDSTPLPPVEKGRPPRQVLRLTDAQLSETERFIIWFALVLVLPEKQPWNLKMMIFYTLKSQSPQTEDFSTQLPASSLVFSGCFVHCLQVPAVSGRPGHSGGEHRSQRRGFPNSSGLLRLRRPAKSCSSSLRRCRCCLKWTKGVVWLGIWGFLWFLVVSCWVGFFSKVLNLTWEILMWEVYRGTPWRLWGLKEVGKQASNEHRTMGGKCIAQTLAMEDFMMEEAWGVCGDIRSIIIPIEGGFHPMWKSLMIDDWQPWHELVAPLMLMSSKFKKCSQVPWSLWFPTCSLYPLLASGRDEAAAP